MYFQSRAGTPESNSVTSGGTSPGTIVSPGSGAGSLGCRVRSGPPALATRAAAPTPTAASSRQKRPTTSTKTLRGAAGVARFPRLGHDLAFVPPSPEAMPEKKSETGRMPLLRRNFYPIRKARSGNKIPTIGIGRIGVEFQVDFHAEK